MHGHPAAAGVDRRGVLRARPAQQPQGADVAADLQRGAAGEDDGSTENRGAVGDGQPRVGEDLVERPDRRRAEAGELA
jgi:hypothetical protein